MARAARAAEWAAGASPFETALGARGTDPRLSILVCVFATDPTKALVGCPVEVASGLALSASDNTIGGACWQQTIMTAMAMAISNGNGKEIHIAAGLRPLWGHLKSQAKRSGFEHSG